MADSKLIPSYWHTPLAKPLEWLCLHQQLNKWAQETPNKEAYVVRMNGKLRESITFKELRDKAQALAAGLLVLGLKYGDCVIVTGITSLDWILCDFACATAGIRTVLCRMSVLTKEGLLTIANRNNCKAIFFHPGENGELEEHLRKCIPDAFMEPQNGTISCGDIPCLRYMIGMSRHNDDHVQCVKRLLKEDADLEVLLKEQEKVQPDDILTCYMTSGSSGFPKAIPYTHFTLLNLYKKSNIVSGLMLPTDRVLNDRSLSWAASFIYVPLTMGLTMVYVHPMTNAKDNDMDFLIEVIQSFFQY